MGSKTLSTECTLASLTRQKEKTLKDMLASGIQGKAGQESKTLFAEMLTNSGSLKIQFYYQVKSLPVSRVLSTLIQALSLHYPSFTNLSFHWIPTCRAVTKSSYLRSNDNLNRLILS